MSTFPLFDGRSYEPTRDGDRLNTQLAAVRHVLSDGRWHTTTEISRALAAIGIFGTETSISSRVRDLRKAKFGAYDVQSRYVEKGLWAYRMEVIS